MKTEEPESPGDRGRRGGVRRLLKTILWVRAAATIVDLAVRALSRKVGDDPAGSVGWSPTELGTWLLNVIRSLWD
ncbi:hypothetical protein GCM10009764_67370 [Nocardia ninae]|uniref:Uncharacterized protein n=1 Tax=Nocardia ninae NBRC 108245 TaxID=1210091 RepID=A0A511M7A3_9NOCA|nr:hypothetical protein NN4_10430 [Nocardia ninae NBRC 108245]